MQIQSRRQEREVHSEESDKTIWKQLYQTWVVFLREAEGKSHKPGQQKLTVPKEMKDEPNNLRGELCSQSYFIHNPAGYILDAYF